MNIGFIGLGNMGSGMAANLLKAGHTLIVNDLRHEAAKPLLDGGASWGDTPKAIAESSDIVFTSLPGPQQIEEVALGKDGIIEGIHPGFIYIDVSTSSPSLSRRIYDVFKEKGAHVMDAPVTGGGPPAAREGRLNFMMGGDEDVFKKCQPVLEACANIISYTGGIGTATICKLVHNCIGFGLQSLIAESFSAGVKAGVDPVVLWQALKDGGVGKGGMVNVIMPGSYLQERYEQPLFSLDLAYKDLSLATSMGLEFQVPMAISNLVQQEFIDALNRGWGSKDATITMSLQNERADVKIKVPEAKLK
jgi:3-hydroxyisobutyrate dehydrogenase-like beta-hydroxyacid dehydrogenase